MKHFSHYSNTHFFTLVTVAVLLLAGGGKADAQGWPKDYDGVMLQGFYWDSFSDSKWSKIEKQADELSQYFSLIWIPQSGKAKNATSMGYDPLYYYNQNSSFGSENELKSMIKAYQAKGVGIIADVVVNHRGNVSNWVDFPKETSPLDGKTYQMVSTDICANDDGGATKTWATQNGYSLSTKNDTGEDWGGMRDLDHSSANVQENVKAYLKYLIDYLGYTGFRYDMVKGFGGEFLGQYNAYAQPRFSVGEYWDGNANTVKSWIDKTGKQSAAFDFAFRYTVRDAVRGYRDGGSNKNKSDWSLLGTNTTGITVAEGNYKQYAVTFVENHDTQYRSANEQNDPIRKDTLAANAYLLAMPGTPSVFLPHWQAYKQEIKSMILARKAAGITNTSTFSNFASKTDYYVVNVNGSKGKLIASVGTKAEEYTHNRYVRILSGYHYSYHLSKDTEIAWVDKASGEYDGAFDVTLTAVSNDDNAQLVYTLDGTEPSANSKKVASGTKIRIDEGCRLKVALLVGGAVKGVITRDYVISKFEKYSFMVYVNTDNVGWSNVNFHIWGGDGTHAAVANWPGERITATTTVGGRTWYCKEFTMSNSNDFVNFVFSTGTGSPQTVDVENVTKETYFEISTEKDGSKYKVNDVTSQYATGISATLKDDAHTTAPVAVYTVDGRRVRMLPAGTSVEKATEGLQRGIYIINGRKYMK